MNDDNGTSGGNAAATRRHQVRSGLCNWHALLLVIGAWACGIAPVAATLQEYGSIHAGNQVTVRRQIVIKRGTWPVTTSFEYHNGVNWVNIGGVGPGKTDMVLDYNGSTYAISKSMSGTNSGPVGSYIDIVVPEFYRDLQCKIGPTSTVNWVANCEQSSATFRVTKLSSGSSGSSTWTETPPVYILYEGGSEGGGPVVDNGNLPDNDNDGIPDNEDPDDDNDGRPDVDDAFPLDPNEQDDTDGDGIGNGGDPDDDNDGTPDVDDDHPYDPTKQHQDSDGDGVRDTQDAFPTNPREWADADGDGVGDNIDPDDNSPPKAPGETDGNGEGDPGTGDGGGGPGPIPNPGDDGTKEGATGTGDTSGAVKPTSAHEFAAKGSAIAPALGGKLGQFNVFADQLIPRVNTYTFSADAGLLGQTTYTLDFTKTPFPQIRAALFILGLVYCARSAINFLKV